MAPVIEEIVSLDGSVRLDIKGTSMMPLLRNEKDAVILEKPLNLQKFDVVLFRKKDGYIALHRIVNITNDTYTIIGDNQYRHDSGIKKSDLIAKATVFCRGKLRINERQIRLFGAVWYSTYPLRKFLKRGFSWIKRRLSTYGRSLKNKFR